MTSTAAPPTAMGTAADPLDACGCDAGALATRATAVGADGTLGPPFDHLALLVTAQERWLTDVGWGDQFVRPLRVDGSGVQSDGRTTYRITATHADRILARRHDDSTWEPLYHFTLDAHPLAAFGPTCRYHQSAPEAPFTQRLLCTRLTSAGRVTVSGNTLIETERSGRRERILADDAAIKAALWEHFGLVRSLSGVSADKPAH